MNKLARVLMITLRIAIGWHFLYEGVFKLGPPEAWQQPATARYYLQSSVARLQGEVTSMAPEEARERMRQWSNEVAGYFQRRGTPLGDEQKTKLAMLHYSVDPNALDWVYVHEDVLALGSQRGNFAGFGAEPQIPTSAWAPVGEYDGCQLREILLAPRHCQSVAAHGHRERVQQPHLRLGVRVNA